MKDIIAFTFKVVCLCLITNCSTKEQLMKKPLQKKSISYTKSSTNNEVYRLIDTTKIYQLVALYYKHDSRHTNIVSEYNYKKYLKFYSEGRFAVYDDFDILKLDTLKAKVTDQGYYDYSYKTIYTKHFITNKDGKQFYNPQSHTMTGDTLSLYSESTKNISHYLPISIPKTTIVNKADW